MNRSCKLNYIFFTVRWIILIKQITVKYKLYNYDCGLFRIKKNLFNIFTIRPFNICHLSGDKWILECQQPFWMHPLIKPIFGFCIKNWTTNQKKCYSWKETNGDLEDLYLVNTLGKATLSIKMCSEVYWLF